MHTRSRAFYPLAGCRHAQNTQPVHLIVFSHVAARAPAGHRSPTKSTQRRASKDTNRQANAIRGGRGTVMAAPRPTARRRATSQLPRSPSRPRKRHENTPSGADRRRRLRPPETDTPSEQTIGRRVRRYVHGRWRLHHTGYSQLSARAAPETQTVSGGRVGPAGQRA